MSTCLNSDGTPRVYAAPSPIKLSSGVAAAQIVHKVIPIYPASAKQAHISGATVVHILIDEEGNVADAAIVSGPQALRESVLTAVRQWKYKPYVLNGVAVPIDTTVAIILDFGA